MSAPRREHTTQTGRIVYDRKKHLFDGKDIKRITRSLFKRATTADQAFKMFILLTNIILEEYFQYGFKKKKAPWSILEGAIMGTADIWSTFASERIASGQIRLRALLTIVLKGLSILEDD